MMLEAIAGNIDVQGGRCRAVGASWKNTFPKPSSSGVAKLKIIDGDGSVPFPTHHICEHVLKQIKDGSHGRPDTYMIYCYNPAYVNGECKENIEVLKDKSLIPYLVAVDVSYSESTALADLILPDTPYTERWDWEDMASMDQIPEYYIRQPLIKPLGESRDFKDVCCELARRLGGEVAKYLPFQSAEEFVRDACDNTPGVKEAGGFEYMKQHGAWVDPEAKPKYKSYAKILSKEDREGAILDKPTGVFWKGEEGQDYTSTKSAYKKYVGQVAYDGKVYSGFTPDKVNKSGLLEIHSKLMEAKGLPAIPTWMPIPEHGKMQEGQVILTTYKAPTQTHSRTQNCKYLTELFHRNAALINPVTAEKFGIEDEDKIKVTSEIGSITIEARVTEGIVPGVVAIANHCGHWEYGRYASGKKAPLGTDDDLDLDSIWWDDRGSHPNWVMPNAPDPIAGQQRFMDTVVTIELA
ncbi:MAG: molybdopterin dinucleotide binding domain-containing protein [Planctomycetota bacterium]|jgi:anaerobic selenocysteine-containing dehydrogenase